MLKMYEPSAYPGGSAAYWESNWQDVDFDQALRFCEVDPLRPLFERCALAGARMLEGGCGPGYYVTHYGARGVTSVGLDFAVSPLVRLRRRDPAAALCAGDVKALPFRNESFDVYYSGGVVEHFENGCEQALHECRRVLRRNGVLLISVPYFSPLRRALCWIRPRWRPVAAAATEAAPADNLKFFQYAYRRVEFERLLHDAGLRVRSVMPYSVMWGLFEVPGIQAAIRRTARRRPSRPGRPPAAVSGGGGGRASLLKRIVVSEDKSLPIAGPLVTAAGWLFANMIMFECVRDDREPAVAVRS